MILLSNTLPQPNYKELYPLDQTLSCIWVPKATPNYHPLISQTAPPPPPPPQHQGVSPVRKTHRSMSIGLAELRSCVKIKMAILGSPILNSLCECKATLNLNPTGQFLFACRPHQLCCLLLVIVFNFWLKLKDCGNGLGQFFSFCLIITYFFNLKGWTKKRINKPTI